MKKYVIYLFLFIFLPLAAMAQSSMTDQQVMQYIVKEHNSGKSQSEIVTKLMQRGVDISQIRRVRNKYERQMKQGGLGNVSDNTTGKDESRLRTNNGNPRELTKRDDYGKEATQKASQYSNMRLKATASIRTPTTRPTRSLWTISVRCSSLCPIQHRCLSSCLLSATL